MMYKHGLSHAMKGLAAGLSVISMLAVTVCVPALAVEGTATQPQTTQMESSSTDPSTSASPTQEGTEGAAPSDTGDSASTSTTEGNTSSQTNSAADGSLNGMQQSAPRQQTEQPQAQSADTATSKLNALAAANKDLVPSGEYTISSALNTDLVLDVAGGDTRSGSNVQIYTDNATAAQRWKVTNDNGYLTIVNEKSGKALDVAWGSNQPGANVQQYTSNNSQAQRWIAVPNGDYVTLRSAVDPSKQLVLDVTGGNARSAANVQTFTGNGTKAQQWKFETPRPSMADRLDSLAAANKDVVSAGEYTVSSGLRSTLVLDVSGGSKSNGANVQNYEDNATAAQRWKVVKDSKGYLMLINKASGKALDVAGGSAASGTNVQQFASNGSRAQKWIAIPVGNKVVLQSAIAVLHPPVLDVAGGSAKSGANVQVYTRNDSNAQQWTFEAPRPGFDKRLDQLATDNKGTIAPGTYSITSALSANLSLDVAGGSTGNSANVQIYTDNITPAQRWKVTQDATGYLTITNEGSGKVLDVDNGNNKPGTNVQQFVSNGTRAQKWVAIRTGDNVILRSALVSGNTARALDVAGGTAKSGANVQIFTANGTVAQQWKFVALPEVKAPIRTYWNKNLWLGRPTATAVTTEGGYKQTFQNVVVYYRSSSQSVFSVRGEILNKYNSLNAEQGVLGFPTGEMKTDSTKHAQTQQFERGQIAWSRNNGAFTLQGDIAAFWTEHQSGPYWAGYPKSDATTQEDGSATQTFEQGTLISDVNHTAVPSIWTRWTNENGADGALGKAADNIVVQRTDGSYVKQFANGIIAATSNTDVDATHVVSGEVYTYWLKHQTLGDPTSELTDVRSGSWQSFTGGTVYVSAKYGTHAVRSPILEKYVSLQSERGTLGYPTSEQRLLKGGVSQSFQHGEIHWSSATGTHFTRGAIQDYWKTNGGQTGWLGYPTTDETTGLRDGGASQRFQGGTVFKAPQTSAHAVKKSILKKYADIGYENSTLGYPTSEENNLGSGVSQVFQHGEIHWSSATGAHFTRGAIQDYWAVNGWQAGWLGYPTTDETTGLRDGGASQRFQGGTVFKAPQTSAHGVTASILADYASRGFENSSLGYPTSEEYDYGKGRAQNFQYGRLVWNGCGKRGWQNPAGFFQVSSCDVSVPQNGKFGYASPSRIGMSATREQAVEAMISRAYDYLGTRYVWDYALRPGEGVDCAGLVMQSLYATGMNLGDYNPSAHWYDPYHSHDANNMAGDRRFKSVGLNDRRRGDLLFWPGHVAIYLGNDQIIEAWPGQVRTANMWVHGTPTVVKRPFV
ncbi:RICIN domain-containing protein [Bifidobacterium sp. CP2]|uniref:RICIN domain-containing protein n=1 Tax=Bifidobacterium sp. CP2 TaxID=2809025 RepID=UPI001BDBEEE5|nr:RICIN domain-containing protein [Bifidobacterium sp. CP2]MBT1182273.1 RICIN domain-containing protein [Bifidobacterium sp. CP2]